MSGALVIFFGARLRSRDLRAPSKHLGGRSRRLGSLTRSRITEGSAVEVAPAELVGSLVADVLGRLWRRDDVGDPDEPDDCEQHADDGEHWLFVPHEFGPP
jgi:hypothetical protein